MIKVNIIDTDETLYKSLMKYCLNGCNEVSFHFPGVSDDGKPLNDSIWVDYHKNTADFKKKCFNHGGRKTCSKHYAGMKLGLYSIIIHVELFDYIKQTIIDRPLFDWTVQNNLPEDVCLYKNGVMRIFSCSHDEEFHIYNETDKDINFLSSNGFEFYVFKD